MPVRLPRWLRMLLFVLVLCLAVGMALKGAHEFVKPATLTLAAGSVDGEAIRVLTAIGSRMAATDAKVRINIVDKGSSAAAAEAFARGEAQLAVVRADNEELGSARAVVQLTNLVVMIVVPPNSPIKTLGDLRGKMVGVIGLDANQGVLRTLVKSYGFAQGSVNFVDLPPGQIADVARAKRIQAVIVVAPLAERYLALARSIFPAAGKSQPRVLEIDSAEAIALENKTYESFDLPKGALRGAPPLPDDSVSTLRLPVYLVAGAKVSDDKTAALAKSIMDIRRELAGESSLVAQIAAPDDDKNAAIPIHPGAKAFFDGSEKTWSDKYGDWLFYGPIILGMLGSFMAAVWKFLTTDGRSRSPEMLSRICDLVERSRKAGSQDEMDAIERDSDALLNEYMQAQIKGEIDSDQAARLNVMINHLESVIERRVLAFRLRPA